MTDDDMKRIPGVMPLETTIIADDAIGYSGAASGEQGYPTPG